MNITTERTKHVIYSVIITLLMGILALTLFLIFIAILVAGQLLLTGLAPPIWPMYVENGKAILVYLQNTQDPWPVAAIWLARHAPWEFTLFFLATSLTIVWIVIDTVLSYISPGWRERLTIRFPNPITRRIKEAYLPFMKPIGEFVAEYSYSSHLPPMLVKIIWYVVVLPLMFLVMAIVFFGFSDIVLYVEPWLLPILETPWIPSLLLMTLIAVALGKLIRFVYRHNHPLQPRF